VSELSEASSPRLIRLAIDMSELSNPWLIRLTMDMSVTAE
jgi:hypothetical protein